MWQTDHVRQRSSLIAPIVASVFVAAFALFLGIAAWPGLFSWDSVEQAVQGYRFSFTNGHPPFYSFLLGAAAHIWGTPAALFPVQLLLLFGALAALAWARPSPAMAIGVVLLALLPNLWTLAVTHWKDTWVLIGLLWWAALIEAGRARASMLPLVAMVLFRHNAIALAAPLAVLSALALPTTKLRRTLLLVLTWATLVWAPKGVERALGTKDVWPVGFTVLHDTLAIYARHGFEYRRGPQPAWKNSRKDLMRAYNPCTVWPLVNSETLHYVSAAELPLVRNAVKEEWWRLVRAHPRTWIDARLRYFKCMLRIDREKPAKPFQLRPLGGRKSLWPIAVDQTTRAWTLFDKARTYAAFETPLFLPKVWLLPALLALVVAGFRRRLAPVVVAVAGVLYELTYLLAGPAAEHRYSVPFEIACALALLLALAPRTKRP
jgi:hypothetical protein